LSAKIGIDLRIKLQLTGKISLKLDSNSSLFLEDSRKSSHPFLQRKLGLDNVGTNTGENAVIIPNIAA